MGVVEVMKYFTIEIQIANVPNDIRDCFRLIYAMSNGRAQKNSKIYLNINNYSYFCIGE